MRKDNSARPSWPRRRFLASGLVAATPQSPGGASAKRDTGLIQRENRRLGATDWQLTRVRLEKRGGVRSPWIEGYCSRQSVEAGERLQIMVSTRPASRFRIELFRLGYYGGRGARLMTTLGPFNGKPQEDPPVGEARLRECRWEPSTELTIPADWPSGVYLGRLSNLPEDAKVHGWQNYIIFIVRDWRPADILFQCSDNTWQAYNKWPDNYSLYTDPRHPWAPGVAVSFDRPYGLYPQVFENPQSLGSGEFLLWEFPLAYWLEMHGYDVTYCANADMLDPRQILRARVFLSVGHDEYWDVRQYDNALAGVKQGVSQLYLSGNSVYGLTPFLPSGDGRANRVLRRDGVYGGVSRAEEEFFKIPFPKTAPDEALLMGAATPYPFNGGGDWIVTKPGHWMFAGSGMKAGDSIPGLVGWEFHGGPAAIPGLEVVAEGDALSGGVRPSHWTATMYPGPKKNFVFNASTIWWAQALATPPGHTLPWAHWVRPHGPDARVQRITENLLRRALGRSS
jgi:hypothetical protein